MLRKVAASLWVCAALSDPALAQDSPRIASTSLCGDAYVRALAPHQIVALSAQSRDPLSGATEAEKRLPQIYDDPETVIGTQADLIIFGPGEGHVSAPLLEKAGRSSLALKWGETFDSVAENYRMLGDALGRPDKAKALIADQTQRLANLKQGADVDILYLSRAGGTAGAGTFVDAAIRAAGGRNVMSRAGWFTPDTEMLITLKPDLIVTSFFTDGYESVQAPGHRHKAVADFIRRHPRVDIPGRLWPCAGPDLIVAAEMIAEKAGSLR